MTEEQLLQKIYQAVADTGVTYKQIDCDLDEQGDMTIFFSGLEKVERVRVAPPWVRGDKKHGSPRDRGSADRYYGRPYNPHWHWYSDHGCQVVESEHMTVEEIGEYNEGYNGETGEKVWFEPEPQEEY